MIAVLQARLKEPRRHNTEALFPNILGDRLSSEAVQYLLGKIRRQGTWSLPFYRCSWPSESSRSEPMLSYEWPGCGVPIRTGWTRKGAALLAASLSQSSEYVLVNYRLEWSSCPARLGLEACGNIVIEGERCTHTS